MQENKDNNQMGMTRDLFVKNTAVEGNLYAKIGTIKNKGKDLLKKKF